MEQEILLKQKIGLRLSRAGFLSRLFAIQTFSNGGHDLSPEQFTVLYTLKINDGMFLRQLADITCKDRPNMTRIVSILEEKGYLTTCLDTEGRQVKKMYITEKGKRVCDKTLPVILKIWEDSVCGLRPEEIDSFLSTLDKIERNIKERTQV